MLDFDQLRSAGGFAHETSTGDRITAEQARRLACQAGIIPVVLGGDSVPLDLGRKQRLYEDAQRVAMILRDKKCRAEGCDIPAGWCEGHHKLPWGHDGETNYQDGVLLCPWHAPPGPRRPLRHRLHGERRRQVQQADVGRPLPWN